MVIVACLTLTNIYIYSAKRSLNMNYSMWIFWSSQNPFCTSRKSYFKSNLISAYFTEVFVVVHFHFQIIVLNREHTVLVFPHNALILKSKLGYLTTKIYWIYFWLFVWENATSMSTCLTCDNTQSPSTSKQQKWVTKKNILCHLERDVMLKKMYLANSTFGQCSNSNRSSTWNMTDLKNTVF